jgi:AraC family transcriptional regulator of adaptative response/methylated-DNA-[protein]-cysteine methyltransferase
VASACRLIETAESAPALGALAAHVGLSPYHFHRLFKAATGLTPRAYAAAHRATRVRSALARGEPVTRALYDAGYGSSGRFYAQAGKVLGMTPSRFRAGGIDEVIHYATARCTLGTVLVAASAHGICAILLGDRAAALARQLKAGFPGASVVDGDKAFARTVARVVALVEAPKKGLHLPLDVRGTAFQQRVWQALRDIPAGTTVTYGEVAQRIGAPRAVRAVGNACAANNLAVPSPATGWCTAAVQVTQILGLAATVGGRHARRHYWQRRRRREPCNGRPEGCRGKRGGASRGHRLAGGRRGTGRLRPCAH